MTTAACVFLWWVIIDTITALIVRKAGFISSAFVNKFTALTSIGFGPLDTLASLLAVIKNNTGCELAAEMARIGNSEVPVVVRSFGG